MTERRFPIDAGVLPLKPRRLKEMGVPAVVLSIPWALIAPHEAQALANLGHSLDYLAEHRDGMTAAEAVAVLEDRQYRVMPHAESNARLLELMGTVA